MSIDTAFVLAAGRGQRLDPFTRTLPKPLLQVGERRLVEYLLSQLSAAGITKVVMNASYRWEQIVQTLKDGRAYGLDIEYSLEETLLNTAGGIIEALDRLPEHFILINSDILTDYPFAQLQQVKSKAGHLVLAPNPVIHPNGDFSLSEEGEITQAKTGRYTYTGIAQLSHALFDGFEPGPRPLIEIFQKAIADQQLTGELYSGQWQDIGTIDALQAAKARMVSGYDR